MLKKYAGLILTAIISSLLGCAAFFLVLVPLLTQPSVDTGNISLQATNPTMAEPTTPVETLPEETIPETEPPPTVPIPEDLDLDYVAWVSPSVVRGYISTWDQALELIQYRSPILVQSDSYSGYGMLPLPDVPDGYGCNHQGEEHAAGFPDSSIYRVYVPTIMTYFLSDDMEIYTCVAFWHDRDPYDGMNELLHINCIKTPYGYEFRDPAAGLEFFNAETFEMEPAPEFALPEAKVKTLEEYFEILESDPDLAELVDAFYILPHGCFFEINWDSDGIVTSVMSSRNFIPQTPAIPLPWLSREITAGILPLWGNNVEGKEDTLQHPLTVNSGWLPHENLYNIEQYDLYNYLGGTTLTPEEAIALTREEPEVVKEKVKTAADVLLYMMAARIVEGYGCYCADLEGSMWHWNMSAEQIMNYREGGCGSCANLANYLLEGDYEEVGFIDHAYRPGSEGSHIYNYIFHEGKYYVVDFSWYMFNKYDLEIDFTVPVLDSLEEWGKLGRQYYSNVNTIIAYTTPGRHLPCVFGDAKYFDQNEMERVRVFPAGAAELYYPEGAEFTILYQDKTGYKIVQKPFDRTYYDWTLLEGGAPAGES